MSSQKHKIPCVEIIFLVIALEGNFLLVFSCWIFKQIAVHAIFFGRRKHEKNTLEKWRREGENETNLGDIPFMFRSLRITFRKAISKKLQGRVYF